MPFIEQCRSAIEAAPLAALDDISRRIWSALAAGAIGDDDAQQLAEALHVRRQAAVPPTTPVAGTWTRPSLFPPRRPQRAPIRAVAIARRRRVAASGALPPAIAARFTTGQTAVLAILAAEVAAKGVCDITLAEIAARAGVCRSLAQEAIRLAEREELIAVTRERPPGQRNKPNVIRIISREWAAWIARRPRRGQEGGFRNPAPTNTSLPEREESRGRAVAQGRGEARGGASAAKTFGQQRPFNEPQRPS